ncbi:beta-hydroxyacyl-ACP dehydratase [Roseomonas sp. KE2513]|uniref:3-hydroxyacyl-ACP dehydratase FabZ family protein n=1 Tax=Roseomonas sp. KE2513 TaxID=2479202 RepID=UPI0018E004BE|nr:3-hydroxyacyl-ACP dehydratase FabZ family protein [Roseomonas sp. KE2513]MBI0536799.1 beta-hydroxyacyl-ACP dehydratase [Roseomonas sp. KE2513]
MRLEYFQMIDRVVSLDGDAIVVESRVPEASPVFEGHFPGHPLVPGVLLVETMAQASGWLILGRNGFARMPFLMTVKEAKFRSFVGPDAPLDVTARISHEGSGYTVTEARLTSRGKRIAEAEILLRSMPFPNPELEAAMRANAARIGLPGYGA